MLREGRRNHPESDCLTLAAPWRNRTGFVVDQVLEALPFSAARHDLGPSGPRLLVETKKPPREGHRVGITRRETFAGDNRGFVLRRLLFAGDLVGLSLCWGLALGGAALFATEAYLTADIILFVALLPAWFLIANAVGIYHLSERRLGHSVVDEVGPIALALTMWSWVFLLARIAFEPGPIDALPSVLLWIVALGVLPATRAALRVFARHQGWYRQRVAVIGTPGDANRVIRRLERHPELGLELCCVVRIETAPSSANGFIDLRPMSREDREPREARDLAAELVGWSHTPT